MGYGQYVPRDQLRFISLPQLFKLAPDRDRDLRLVGQAIPVAPCHPCHHLGQLRAISPVLRAVPNADKRRLPAFESALILSSLSSVTSIKLGNLIRLLVLELSVDAFLAVLRQKICNAKQTSGNDDV